MDAFEPVLWGVSLAACAGFRAFLPFFFVGAMTRFAGWEAPPLLSWVATDEGFWILAVATVLEAAGDKIPIVDHALDAVQAFVKPMAGFLLPLGFLWEASPAAAWVLGLAAGAPLALGVHASKATVRGASTLFTGGLGNALLSIVEDVLAVLLIVLTLLVPFAAALLLVWLLVRAYRFIGRRRSRAAPA